jgi:hypothetical protein
MHAAIDEEKRVKVQEMRKSGVYVEHPKGSDVPFGVRAIESGIEVDGIWISSKTSTPLPNNLRNLPSSTSQSSQSSDSASLSDSQGSTPIRQNVPRNTSSHSTFDKAVGAEVIAQDQGSARRGGYKPRQSSALRYSSYGEGQVDATTLGALEGKRVQADRTRTARQRGSADSASDVTTDPDRSSGSDSDDTLSNGRSRIQGTDNQRSQNKGTDYFPLPTDDARMEKLNPFITPDRTPLGSPRFHNPANDSAVDSQQPLLTSTSPELGPLQSVPSQTNEPRANQSVRKVNPGFEVLPAGTFGPNQDTKGKGVERESETATPKNEKRWSNKLSKKNRNSYNLGRTSSFVERI